MLVDAKVSYYNLPDRLYINLLIRKDCERLWLN